MPNSFGEGASYFRRVRPELERPNVRLKRQTTSSTYIYLNVILLSKGMGEEIGCRTTHSPQTFVTNEYRPSYE